MSWGYRVRKCEVCKTRAVVMTSPLGRGLCAQCGSDPDGVYYKDLASIEYDKLIKLMGEQAAGHWYYKNINLLSYWKTISEILALKLASLECTCREDKNATCPACVTMLRAQEVEA